MKRQIHWFWAVLFILSLFTITACGSSSPTATPAGVGQEVGHAHEMIELSPVSLGAGEKLQVVATTSIVADVVANVGGDRIELNRLMPLGADPHSFEPTPRDIAAVSDAHVVFANGVGLEAFLEPLLENAGASDKVVHVSEGVDLLYPEREVADSHNHADEGTDSHDHADEGADPHDHAHEGADPHVWTDPQNVMVWTDNIAQALGALDPAGAGIYEANAQAYRARLEELDAWVHEQVAQVPEANRKIVTDHQLFAYFAEAYGFQQVGAIVPGYSTGAEPSAKELAELEDAIRDLGVKAVFVGNTVNPDLARRVAQDTGIRLVTLYTGSLSEKGGEAEDYVDYVRYNVNAIVEALQ